MSSSRTRPPWFRLVFFLGLGGFIVMADNWVVSPLLPSIGKGLGVSAVHAGILIAAYMLPFGLFQLVFGPIGERIGKLRLIFGSLLVFGMVTAIGGLMGSLTALVVMRAATGMFAAATIPVSLALISDVVPLAYRQRAIGTFMGISFLGQGLSMLVGGTIAALLSWRAVFMIYGLAAVFIALLIASRSGSLATPPGVRGSVLAPYRRLLGRWDSLRIYLIVLTEGVLIIGLFSFQGALLAARHSLGPFEIGAVMTGYGLAALVFGQVSARLAARVGKTNLIGLGLLLAAGSAFALFLSADLAVAAVAIFGLGAAFIMAHSSLLIFATEFAQQNRGISMGLVAFALMGGGAIGTTLGGRVITRWGFSTYLAIWAVGLVLSGVVSRVALRGAEARMASALPGPVGAANAEVVGQHSR